MNHKLFGYGNECKKSICKHIIKTSTLPNSNNRCYKKCKQTNKIYSYKKRIDSSVICWAYKCERLEIKINLSIFNENIYAVVKDAFLHVIESYTLILPCAPNPHSRGKLGHHNEYLPDPLPPCDSHLKSSSCISCMPNPLHSAEQHCKHPVFHNGHTLPIFSIT